MNNYGIFFTLGDKVIRLPVNPSELPDTLEGNNETVNILGIGDVTVQKTPQQRLVELSGLFPARPDYYVHTPNRFMKPEEYIEFFRNAMYDHSVLIYTPVRYTEDGLPFATNDTGFNCTVEGFIAKEKAGETGDFYYELSIKEYRDYAPQVVTIESMPKLDSTDKGVTVTVKSTRNIPDGTVAVGSTVEVNGPVSATPGGKGTTKTGVTAKVARIEDLPDVVAAPLVMLKDAAEKIVGWIPKKDVSPTTNSDSHRGTNLNGVSKASKTADNGMPVDRLISGKQHITLY